MWSGTNKCGRAICLRAALDYGEEVHGLRISDLEDWSNMIGYGMDCALARVYAMAKTSLVENFKLD